MSQKVILEDGKYTFYITESYIPKCDRYNEQWREFLGDKAIYSLISHTIELQNQLQAAPELLEACQALYEILLNGMTADYDYMTEQLGKAKQAVAKAKGETP